MAPKKTGSGTKLDEQVKMTTTTTTTTTSKKRVLASDNSDDDEGSEPKKLRSETSVTKIEAKATSFVNPFLNMDAGDDEDEEDEFNDIVFASDNNREEDDESGGEEVESMRSLILEDFVLSRSITPDLGADLQKAGDGAGDETVSMDEDELQEIIKGEANKGLEKKRSDLKKGEASSGDDTVSLDDVEMAAVTRAATSNKLIEEKVSNSKAASADPKPFRHIRVAFSGYSQDVENDLQQKVKELGGAYPFLISPPPPPHFF